MNRPRKISTEGGITNCLGKSHRFSQMNKYASCRQSPILFYFQTENQAIFYSQTENRAILFKKRSISPKHVYTCIHLCIHVNRGFIEK